MSGKSKGSFSYYKKKLKKLFSEYIKSRAGDRCEASGKIDGYFKDCGGYNQCSHVHSVGAYSNLQFDPMNALCLCYRHHIHWWHKETGEAWEWFKKPFPNWQWCIAVVKFHEDQWNFHSIIIPRKHPFIIYGKSYYTL